MKKNVFLILFLMLGITTVRSQDESQTEDENENQEQQTASGDSKFLLAGYGFSTFEMDETKSSFGESGFSPIFIWKNSDRLFAEAEMEIEIEDGSVAVGLEYLDINTVLFKYMTLRTGLFLSPFNTFGDRYHPAWINKFASKPLGLSHDGIVPTTELGAAIGGGIPLGSFKINYSLFVSNGPSLKTGEQNIPEVSSVFRLSPAATQTLGAGHGGGTETAGEEGWEAGMLSFDNLSDNNRNKAVGVRIGVMPFSASSLEIGLAMQTARVGDMKKGGVQKKSYVPVMVDTIMEERLKPEYDNIDAQLWGVDINWVHSLPWLKGIIDLKGQFNNATVDKTDYYSASDSLLVSFDNVSQLYYAQLAYRPALLKNKILKNFEITGRYSAFKGPDELEWGEEKSLITLGLNYWTSWRSVIKVNYETNQDTEYAIFMQFAMGF